MRRGAVLPPLAGYALACGPAQGSAYRPGAAAGRAGDSHYGNDAPGAEQPAGGANDAYGPHANGFAHVRLRRPISDMAREAVRLLIEQVRAKRAGTPLPAKHSLLNFTLVKRESTGAGPGPKRKAKP